jgi:hypothetical protein
LGVGLTTPPGLKNIVTKAEEVKTGPICQGGHGKSRPQQGRMGKASLEGQGPPGAVEPLMMMMNLSLKFNTCAAFSVCIFQWW